ncbi:hypothetical protein HTIA_p2871 (plasmid) [Halorhabdus tiamatea SARL4B]|uniref:Uncharacterized protein n=1 Tax=Halorhabdus tiamatea SARL4B TaxID=1033806 RepID=S6D2G3_9EURY|nr:hypothetical protein HTIA_p2871 [Halorhabdus tiamatea SARL4B]
MGIELDVCERHCVDEWFDGLVSVMLEPCFRNEANIRFQR